ncbi:MAG: DUF4294 domain-containing protein [Bacteroidota bacterium]|nr:DUF4294 domain-containing protein [Bacteroidota bacterium]MDP4205261.1 DUF4294 domain-containing protein [Bacteroidota bacterium]
MFAVKKNIKQKYVPIAASFVLHVVIVLGLFIYLEFCDMVNTRSTGFNENYNDIQIVHESFSTSAPKVDKKKDKVKLSKVPQKPSTPQKNKAAEIVQKTEPVTNDKDIAINADTLKKQKVDTSALVAQKDTSKPHTEQSKVDTVSFAQRIQEAALWSENMEFQARNGMMIRNFKKVYPMAKLAQQILEDVDARVETMKNEKEKKKLIKQTEQQLFQQYEDALKHMSFSQGKILLKLISRQTHRDAYTIIKDYKGETYAVVWQRVAKLFNNDLKMDYEPMGQDSLLERIVIKYENGELGE